MISANFKTAPVRWGGLILVMIVCASCTPTPQVKSVNHQQALHQLGIPNRVELTQVPFFPQTKYHCGPAAVTTLLHFQRRNISYNDVSDKVYTPGRKGSLQTDVITAFRRYGFMSYRLRPKLIDLFYEVAGGRPVLVLQNLGVKWIPKWHYAVVIGYDFNTQKIILRSGKYRRKVTPFKIFERTWKRSHYWAIVALKPGELPAIPVKTYYLHAALGLEKVKNWRGALQSYQTAEKTWPLSLIAQIGVANTWYALGDRDKAIAKYQTIVRQFPKAADAHNNLASLLIETKHFKQALRHVNKAIRLGGRNKAIYLKTKQQLRQARTK